MKKRGELIKGVKKIIDAIRRPMRAGFLTMMLYLTVVHVWDKGAGGIIINVAVGLAIWWLIVLLAKNKNDLPAEKKRLASRSRDAQSTEPSPPKGNFTDVPPFGPTG